MTLTTSTIFFGGFVLLYGRIPFLDKSKGRETLPTLDPLTKTKEVYEKNNVFK